MEQIRDLPPVDIVEGIQLDYLSLRKSSSGRRVGSIAESEFSFGILDEEEEEALPATNIIPQISNDTVQKENLYVNEDIVDSRVTLEKDSLTSVAACNTGIP